MCYDVTMINYKKKIYLLSLCLLFGCKTTEQIVQEREVAISNMDNLDICYNLGKQDDFNYWKLIKNEQFHRKNTTHSWDVPNDLCNKAIEMGRAALLKSEMREQRHRDELVDTINSASKSISDGYKKSADAYGSQTRTTCQSYGSETNCISY
ncbi:hypothetical protein BCT01_17325 [Vibrio tasmaniensis]|uniref:Uncharacterized protein n=3 Tax=Vibrio TaxID=662 RepID=B7VNF0_VIBA3|nr:hypothetical protein A152_23360 [Vibrio tasmaniensis 1F-187]OEF85828.1 hypothetical protein A162_09670 [Vibrio tasmaniensis 1F-155]PMN06307.1 hypothetical protein BCT41_06710 [Vibrio splendidus]PMO75489.1 hypothetical protein BCT01_17325 [Vibrio tasmaniensis]CAV18526.1 Hypothetical protein VS_1363 [Vibrio atlanticus]